MRSTTKVAASAGSAFATRVSFRRNGAPAAVPISISPVVNAGSSESSREIPKASNGTRTKFATSARKTRWG
jgi:hypothetical protein